MALQLSRGYASNVGGIIALSFTVLALGVQPLYSAISSKSAYAASYVGVDGQTHVDTAADLQAALDNPSVTYITLDADMTTSSTILLSRSGVRVNGNDKRITYTGDTAGWQGHYVVQAYNVSNVEINSLRVSGGDAGFLINSSQVTLKGNTHVDNNEFGGIEVSRSSNYALPTSALTLQGALWKETYTEANGKPSVWVVNGEGTLDSSTLYQTLVPATHIKADQTQYYLRAQNTGTVATNTTQRTTYTSLAAAVAAASSGDTIELNKDSTLDSMVFLDKSLTLDGKGHTVTAPYSFTTNGVDNAVLTITANNVTVKNLTTTNTSTGAKPHGIVVHQVSGITLTNLSLLNGRAGMIVNASKVVASNITTSGNSWYGINVDKPGAELTMSGVNSHSEAAHIYTESPSQVIIRTNGLYHITSTIGGHAYRLGAFSAPVITNSPVYVNSPQANNQATWTHDGIGVDHYEYREYRNMTEANADADGNTASYWIQNRSASDRSQTVGQSWTSNVTLYYRVVAIDAAGNRSQPSALGTVIIDKTAPTATFTYSNSNGAALTNTDVTVTMTTSEPVHTPTDWNRVDDTHFTRAYADNGKYQVVLTDTSGNVSPAKQFEVKRIDRAAPTVSGVSNGSVVNGPVTLSVFDPKYQGYDGFDAQHGLVVDGATVTTTANTDKTYTYTVTAEGAHTAQATDKAGNVTVLGFTIDTTAPSANVSYDASSWTNDDVTATLTASEAIATPTGWDKVSDTVYRKVFTANSTETVTVQDGAGNSANANVAVSWIDRTAPAFSIANGTLFNTSSVSVAMSEQASLASVTVDGVARTFTGAAPSYAVTVTGEGAHVITAVDAAGNVKVLNISIDSVAPTVVISGVSRNLDGTYAITGTSNDEANVLVSIDGAAAVLVGVTSGSWTYTTGILGSGAHTIDASSTDSAGNTGGAARWDLNVAAEQFFANPQVAPEDQDVLGAQTDDAVAIPVSDQAVKGVSDEKSNNEFSPLGIAWYWWLVVAAGIVGLWWLIATLRRGAKEENL